MTRTGKALLIPAYVAEVLNYLDRAVDAISLQDKKCGHWWRQFGGHDAVEKYLNGHPDHMTVLHTKHAITLVGHPVAQKNPPAGLSVLKESLQKHAKKNETNDSVPQGEHEVSKSVQQSGAGYAR